MPARVSVAVAALALAVCAGPAHGATWHNVPGQFRSQGTKGATNPSLAVASSGRAVLAWLSKSGQVRGAFSDGDGRFGRGRTLGEGRYPAPRVAINARGDAVIAWIGPDGSSDSCCTVLRAAVRPAGGRLSRVQTLSLSGDYVSNFDLAVHRDGTVGVAWRDDDFALAAFALPGGGFGAPLNASHYESAADVQLCFDRTGRATVGWASSEPEPHLAVAQRRPGDRFGPSMVAATDDTSHRFSTPFYPWQLGCMPTGQLATWGGEADGKRTVLAARRSAGRAFSHLTPLSSEGGSERLATAPNGRALVAWLGFGSLGSSGVRVAVRGRSGDFAVRDGILPGSRFEGSDAPDHDVAIDNAGRSVVAWVAGEQTHATLGARDGAFRHTVEIGEARLGPPATGAGGGLAVVVWPSTKGLEVAVAHRH